MNGSLSGTRLGKYEIQAEIGRGGMGAVYKGYDPTLGRYVAVKVLAPHLVWEQEFVERFLREARAAARLKHTNVVTIHDVGQEAGWYYFVMEYLEGPTLTTIVQERGALPPDEALSILRLLADALDYAHSRGLVHRDVKPGNVIVDPAGQATLTDFGIARAARETRLTATGAIIGTPEYMSPEQAKGLAVDARSDQYSLAVVAYEVLSGKVPFEAESTLALLHKIVYDPLPPIREIQPDLPVGVEAVLKKALAKDPGDRYEDVSTFVEALGRALAGEEVVKKPTLLLRPEAPVEPERVMVATPEPKQAALPALDPGRTKVLRDEQPTAPSRRRVPAWAWALGGLAAVVVLTVLFLALRPAPTPVLVSGDPILFTSDRDGKLEIYHLTETSEVSRLTHTPGEGESWSPTLMPDRTIIFVSNRDGKREIYHLAEKGGIARITHTPDGGE
ncbi:MAG: protein kinase, partial [Chloroflexi bacterium]|nr:protein kinase [Chloroflexota bacterium]